MERRPRWLELKMLRRRCRLVRLGPCAVPPAITRCVAAGMLLAAALPTPARALVAACGDGSVVFAKRWEDVHCSRAEMVTPRDVPQLGYVPRDASKERRELRSELEAMRERDLEAQLAAFSAPAVGARSGVPALPPVSLGGAENRDLARLVALAHERSAAAIERGTPPLLMRLAHSRAVEERLRTRLAARGTPAPGPILLFWLEPPVAGLRATLPAFAQRGVTFRPQPTDPGQLGWIPGSDDPPGRGEPRPGYVVLPAGFDPARPLVVFWGDAVAAARLGPE